MFIHKKWYLYGGILCLVILCGVLYINMNKNDKTIEISKTDNPIQLRYIDKPIVNDINNDQSILSTDQKNEKAELEIIRVYICGAVKKPDVYSLSIGSIVKDVLEKAGGATEDADLELINLALELTDQTKIYIPRKGETFDKIQNKEENSNVTTNNEQKQNLININTSQTTELEELPGIGEVKAKAILEYREDHGPFGSIEEIQNVSGIGTKTYEKIKPFITID